MTTATTIATFRQMAFSRAIMLRDPPSLGSGQEASRGARLSARRSPIPRKSCSATLVCVDDRGQESDLGLRLALVSRDSGQDMNADVRSMVQVRADQDL